MYLSHFSSGCPYMGTGKNNVYNAYSVFSFITIIPIATVMAEP